MKKTFILCGLLLSQFSRAGETVSEQTSEPDLWYIILNLSIVGVCILFAVFLLLGLREIRRSFIPK